MVELLVAMVISGLLAGVIFQLLQGQARFVEVQGSRQEVQQNARATLELLASELRAVPPGGVLEANRNRIDFLLPRAWGVLCWPATILQPNAPASGSVWIFFPQGSWPADFPTNLASATDWGLAMPLGAGSQTWATSSMSAVATGTPPANSCGFNQDAVLTDALNTGLFTAREITYSGLSLPLGAVPGAQVFVYQRVTYEVEAEAGSDRIWVRRNNGAGGMQPLAGPLGPEGAAASQGLVFRYHCRNGRMSTAPGLSTTGWPNLTAVQVEVNMSSTEPNSSQRQIERDSTLIQLRNSTAPADCVL